MLSQTTYDVQVLRSGQPRAYADTEREYLITVKSTNYGSDTTLKPWLFLGDYTFGTDDKMRKAQRDWALKVVRALCQNFREAGDEDGKTGMEAALAHTLKWLKLDPKAGTIHVFIVEPYCD